MSRTIRRPVAWIAAAVLLVMASPEAGRAQAPPASYKPGELIIKFRDGAAEVDRAAILGDLGAQTLEHFKSVRADHVRISGIDVEQAVARYTGNRDIAYIEPNYIYRAETVPNDPQFTSLWAMRNLGQTGGKPGADISAVQAWSVTTGSPSVLLAIIDTGVDYTHPDLAANAFVNPGEIPGNGVDDDRNGFVDDVHGWDFANNDNDPMDDYGHGTHVAGICGAVGDNGIGVAGVNWNVRLLPIKFLDSYGSGTTAGAIASVDYAVLMGARVINASWGGGGFSQGLLDALVRADSAGILFAAAAGNDASDSDLYPHYPSGFDVPNIVAVAATDHNDELAWFSTYGATSVDLAAPGVDILSTLPDSSYGAHSGTSMATPHVAGVAALIYGRFPNIDAHGAKALLLDNVDPLPGLMGFVATGGRLNAFKALGDTDTVAPAAVTDLMVSTFEGSWVAVQCTATGDDGQTGTASRYDVRYSTSPITTDNFPLATRVSKTPDPLPPGTVQSLTIRGLSYSTIYYFALVVFDELGNASPLSNVVSITTLGAPHIAVSPDSLVVSLLAGETTPRTLRIDNLGGSPLDWTMAIEDPGPAGVGAASAVRTSWQVLGPASTEMGVNRAGAMPAEAIRATYGAASPRVLLYADSYTSSPGNQYSDRALQSLGLAYTAYYDYPWGFGNALLTGTWDLVIVEHASYYELGNWWNEIEAYLNGGGRVLISTFDIDGSHSEPTTLWSTIGLAPQGDLDAPIPVHWWKPTHPLFNRPEVVPPFSSMQDWYWDDGDRTAPGPGVLDPAGFSATRALDQSAIVVSANRRAIVNTFIISENQEDSDADGKPDAVELLVNEISMLRRPVWLSAKPSEGTVSAGGSAEAVVGFDAAPLVGGDYRAAVVIESNDPDESSVPVTARLYVTGVPDLSVSPASLDFGPVFLGVATQLQLVVTNAGTDTLVVSDITSGDAALTVVPSTFALPCYDSRQVTLTFSPMSAAPLNTQLLIASNDPDQPTLAVPVTGAGVLPPHIVVAPESLAATVAIPGVATQTFTIQNTGHSALTWGLDVQAVADTTSERPAGLLARHPTGWDAKTRTPTPGMPRLGAASAGPLARLPIVIRDPAGDGGPADLVTLRGQSRDGILEIELDLAPPLSLGDVNGCLSLDIDQNGLTGSPPSSGLPEQDIGVEYEVFMFRAAEGMVYLYSTAEGWLGYFAATIGPSSVRFGIPLFLLSADDGVMNVTGVIGTSDGPTDWFPDAGHGTIPGAWLGLSPDSGEVAPGESATVAVTYDTHGQFDGRYRSAILVGSNDPDDPEVVVPVGLTAIGTPELRVSAPALDFGGVIVGLGRELSLILFNKGSRALAVGDVRATGAAFQVVEGAFPAVIPPGDSMTVRVRFSSGTVCSPCSGQLAISSDDPNGNPLVVPLTGSSLSAIAVAPESLAFGGVFIGWSRTIPARLKNIGPAPLVIGALSTTAADFTVTPAAPLTIAPGESAAVVVRFAPTAPGSQSAHLIAASSESGSRDSLALSGTGMPPAKVAVTPSSITAVASPDHLTHRTLRVLNQGAGPLEMTARLAPPLATLPGATGAAVAGAAEVTAAGGPGGAPPDLQAGTGGPDAFGHTWIDSDTPGGPAFQWIDIRETGERVPFSSFADDETVGPLSIGFPFPFYADTFQTFYVGANGCLSFTARPVSGRNLTLPTPETTVAPNLVAGLWDNLILVYYLGSAVHVQHDATRLVVQFTDALHYGPTLSPRHTFQIILDQNGTITYQYLQVGLGATSATVGIQNGARDDGLTIVCDGPYLHDRQAVRIDLPLPWVHLEPRFAAVPPFGQADLGLTFDASGLAEGRYDGRLLISSNDPLHPHLDVPLSFHVAMPVTIGFDLKPEKVKLGERNMEKRISAFFEPPPPFTPADIDVASIRLNGVVAADSTEPVHERDHDKDGIPDLEVHFLRSALALVLPVGEDVPVVATGLLGAREFSGLDSVRVKRGRIRNPGPHDVLAPGHICTLEYDVTNDSAQWVGLLFSPDGGATWTLHMTQVPNTGRFDWPVPNQVADSALVAVVEVEDGAVGGEEVLGVLAVSEPFSIQGALDVTGGGHVTRLLPPRPNPSGGAVRLGFTVAERSEVAVTVFDLQGRRVASLIRGVREPGTHEVVWDGSRNTGGSAGAGLFFVTLRIGSREWRERVVRLE